MPGSPARADADRDGQSGQLGLFAAAAGEGAPPAVSRHPRANRELLLGGALVAYEFQRGQRRTIGLSVGPHGLSVRIDLPLAPP